MPSMNCIIVDEKISSQTYLLKYIEQSPQLKLIAKCETVYEAIDVLQTQKVDLAFVDTEFEQSSGIEFVKNLIKKPLIIFTAQYPQYAAEAFNLDAIDYLVKPFSMERFFKSVQKAFEYFRLLEIKSDLINVPETAFMQDQDFVLFKADFNMVRINIDEILFIEGLKDYIKIFVSTRKKPVVVRNSLKKIQQALPTSLFIRIHKSYIISMRHLSSVNKSQIKIGESIIPIGESYKSQFFSKIQNHII